MLILVVDDELAVLRMATTALAMGGYRAIVAENGVAGLECYMKAQDEIGLVLADVIMPVMTGIEMAEKIMDLQPAARILLMSGYSDDVIDIKARQKFPYIRKPFLPADLIRKIETLLGNSAAAASSES
jgi:CheY-like chemotaxis protein